MTKTLTPSLSVEAIVEPLEALTQQKTNLLHLFKKMNIADRAFVVKFVAASVKEKARVPRHLTLVVSAKVGVK
ncbi:hypothetical protein QN379_02705 [Glaciimonas sp. Gout2]|uniref:hypothetical protein n=1 Tax=unclassified Glaciimonas TaxID=2644401 RepID=UPI002B223027|nr:MULTISPECIES: hypothetical protein [unclassified Glaciimonas]MEB0011275.1 hypothetical protein [Glaciimonas sp. Cout2]MEB0080925.1 hypothetical protein [Glaciimonas sp. Gout2]